MTATRAATFAGLLAVAIAAGGCQKEQLHHAAASRLAQAYLVAVGGGSEDRGWSFLLPITRDTTFRGDREAYVAMAEATDWAEFEWVIVEVERDEPSAYEVRIEVTNGELPVLVATVTDFEESRGPTFLVRFGPAFGGSGIWMVDGADMRP